MYGNLITTVAGFLFAANGVIDWGLFAATTIGTALVISSACVINNYLDQDIDAVMERTSKRPLISGEVSGRAAMIFGILLGGAGFALLSLFTNWLVVGIGAFGWIVYVWLYGVVGKRKSVHGTLVGSLSGAAPILAGYAAVTGGLDWTGIILFAILFFWQEPEFYSISIFRNKEYAKAGVPVSSVVRGITATKRQIFIYTLLTVAALLVLAADYRTGWTYFVLMLVLCARWLQLAAEGLLTDDDMGWSRRMFHFALLILVVFSFIISVNHWLP